MIHTENRIQIAAPAAVIFELAQNVARWPQLLPHYRYVHVVAEHDGGRRRLAYMGARRGQIPVRWAAEQECIPEDWTIDYRHVGGLTLGMQVRWRIEPGERECTVSISHELRSPVGLLRLPFASRIAARWFISAIADQTLRTIRVRAEEVAPTGAGMGTSP